MKILFGVIDNYDADSKAMLQALYSRSYASIETRLELDQKSLKEKLKKYYVNWGHKSVGQLGDSIIFIERVSLLAAKAIQDTPLYDGQESSTRYIDFSTQEFISHSADQASMNEELRAFYIKATPILIDSLKKEFPQGDADPTKWDNTIKARAFDILRGFLPAGASTSLCFKGSFDLINDHFGKLLYHPLQEVRDIAKTVLTDFQAKYPSGSIPIEKLAEDFKYMKSTSDSDSDSEHFYQSTVGNRGLNICYLEGSKLLRTLPPRKKYEQYPNRLSKSFVITFTKEIDFGSYRDLHRHRNGMITMPVLTPHFGFENFYIDSLPLSLKDEAWTLLAKVKEFCNLGDLSKYDLQYSVPIGFKVPFTYQCDLNQVIYILELRTQKTVHQTLRKLCHSWYESLMSSPETGKLSIYVDLDEDNFSLKRGTQTFSELT